MLLKTQLMLEIGNLIRNGERAIAFSLLAFTMASGNKARKMGLEDY